VKKKELKISANFKIDLLKKKFCEKVEILKRITVLDLLQNYSRNQIFSEFFPGKKKINISIFSKEISNYSFYWIDEKWIFLYFI